jgi:hypothetical protein
MGNTQVGAQIHAAEREHRKLEILTRVNEFPVPLRETIERWKEEDTESFLTIIEERLIDLLYGIKGNGLDCDRDTHEEVETAIRFFPQVLCERYWGTHPPIYAQLAYFKSVSFIPLLARLGIELNQFQKEERGGLCYRRWNVFRSLVNTDCRKWYDTNDEYQQRLIDENYVAVLKSLGEMGLLQRQDVQNEDLFWELSLNKSLPERKFRYLVDFDPSCFYDRRPSTIYKILFQYDDVEVFRMAFQLGMLHFPTQVGFLFFLDRHDGCTPFDRACYEYGSDTVTKIVGDVLVESNDCNNGSDGEINKMKALIWAATNSNVHLDGVYFLLRRDPGRYCHAISKHVEQQNP